MIPVRRLNHAVLYVRDIPQSVDFYTSVFSFEVVARMGDNAAFLRARGSRNDHDLGMFAVGAGAPGPERGRVGLYHLAWQVDTIDDLAAARATLLEAGALVGESDHGPTRSLYGRDPDGNEFEVMWMLPLDERTGAVPSARPMPLDLSADLARYSGRATAAEA